MPYVYAACLVCVTIFSTGGKFRLVSNFTELHSLTLAARSYVLLPTYNETAVTGCAITQKRKQNLIYSQMASVKCKISHDLVTCRSFDCQSLLKQLPFLAAIIIAHGTVLYADILNKLRQILQSLCHLPVLPHIIKKCFHTIQIEIRLLVILDSLLKADTSVFIFCFINTESCPNSMQTVLNNFCQADIRLSPARLSATAAGFNN